MKNNKILTIRRILVIIFLIFFGLITYINFKGNYLEYKELGDNFLKIFLKKQKYQYFVMVMNFIVIFVIMYFSGRKIKKGLKIFFDQEKKEMPKLPNKSIALVFSIIESIIIAIKFTPKIILCISNTNFGENDPVFGLDLSFFMFIEPLIKMLITYFIVICIIKVLYAFGYYVIVFNKYFDGIDKKTFLESQIMKTLYRNAIFATFGISIYILISSMDIVFDNFLTTDNNIKLIGAGYIDSTIKYVGYTILSLILFLSVCVAIKNLKKGNQLRVFKSIAVVPIYLVMLFFVMIIFDFVFVNQNEFDKEKKYIESNISATKRAYAIDCNIKTIDYTGTITIDEVQNNQNIINNIVIVDKQTVLNNLKETQTGTGYYTYKTAKLSKYNINGEDKILYISPREIVNNSRTYNSKTYEYTHGYGLIFTSATEFTDNGEVKYIQNDISGENSVIKITKPQIYYGLETNTTVVTNAKDKKEFDYADESKEYETLYSGNSGLKLNFLDRLILGVKEKNIKLALSTSVSSNSSVLINRNILKRAKLVLPDLVYDENPYTVIDDEGKVFWVIDSYTISSQYPYSTYTEIEYNGQKKSINYIRNSIKVLIDAYTGKVKYYITDRTDPIAMGYRKVYPELFEPLDTTIPKSIQEQFIYPEFLYKVQSTLLEEYHNSKADVLYRSDDTWEKAKYKNLQTSKKNANILDAYYTTVSLDNEKNSIGLIQMYTPKNKQNLISYLIGTVQNGENRLDLKIMHSDTNIIGPTQLDMQISQDETIKKEIENLSVTGSKVTKNMLIVPIENTLLYIEPVYQTLVNEDNLPIQKKIIVASGNKVAIGNNLKEAVNNLISQYATNIEIENTEDLEGIIESIIKANDNLSDSLNINNWELMGTDIKKLQELIKTLKIQVESKKKEQSNINNANTNTSLENIKNNTTINE